MKEIQYTGVWWLPEALDNKVSGTLSIVYGNGIFLTLSESFNKDNDSYKYFNAIELAPLLKLKTLDLLHLVYAQELVTKKFIKAFITFDKEILGKKDLILKTLKIEIIGG